ncbi:MAG TPA: hypothetical protein VN673_06495, partial [Clostridia bacterium]|nr:hypothetical protein [Clostridia bacterium]
MSTEPTERPANSVNFQEEKAQLECAKIRAEIATISRPFYRTASFYVSIVPVALALLGVIFTWASGWFDVQRTRINNEKLLIQIETEKLQSRAKEQENRMASLETDLHSLRAERMAVTNQIVLLSRERDEMRSARDFFESQAKRLAGSETNALRLFSELQAAQSDRKRTISQVAQLTATNQFLASMVLRQGKRLEQLDAFVSRAIIMSIDDKSSKKNYDDFISAIFREFLTEKTLDDHLDSASVKA